METAPFRADLADAPEGETVVWRMAEDGIRLRLGAWRPETAQGTILLFPGRTEYIEKYGKVIGDLTRAGWAVATLDWRGQGLSDRLDEDARLGHIVEFSDYQRDVAVLTGWAEDLDLPGLRVLIAHSMGGCIGLRALCNGLAVERAVFSAPMWGIQMPAYARPLTHVLPPVAKMLKRENVFAPGTRPASYVTETGFQENMLTTDRETYAWLGSHAAALPEFSLGGPSVGWVGAATRECAALLALPRPKLPVLTFVGTDEQVVSVEAIERIHRNWSEATLRYVEGARHEVMMETPAIRRIFMEAIVAFFAEAASGHGA